MAEPAICKYNQFGHCKFGTQCQKYHTQITCNSFPCVDINCASRHPKICTYFSLYGKCKFAESCSYLHFRQELPQKNHIQKEIENLISEILKLKRKNDEIIESLKKLSEEMSNLKKYCRMNKAVAELEIELDVNTDKMDEDEVALTGDDVREMDDCKEDLEVSRDKEEVKDMGLVLSPNDPVVLPTFLTATSLINSPESVTHRHLCTPSPLHSSVNAPHFINTIVPSTHVSNVPSNLSSAVPPPNLKEPTQCRRHNKGCNNLVQIYTDPQSAICPTCDILVKNLLERRVQFLK